MIKTKKKFILKKSDLGNKFRVENNNLDLTTILEKNEFKTVKLKDIASFHRENRSPNVTKDVTFKYVQISDIDINLGLIKSCTLYKGENAPNNAKRIMRKDDILISTRRPTRGAIVTVPDEFDGEICSIFFTTIRVHDVSVIDPIYLSLFLRTSFCRYQFQAMITETAYPVINDGDILDMIILLPSIDEQHKLASKWQSSIKNFINQLSTAYEGLITIKQEIEKYILKEDAEKLSVPTFDLQITDSDGEVLNSTDSPIKLNYFKESSLKQQQLAKFL